MKAYASSLSPYTPGARSALENYSSSRVIEHTGILCSSGRVQRIAPHRIGKPYISIDKEFKVIKEKLESNDFYSVFSRPYTTPPVRQ